LYQVNIKKTPIKYLNARLTCGRAMHCSELFKLAFENMVGVLDLRDMEILEP